MQLAVSKIGRPDIAYGPEEPNESDPIVSLRPRGTWTTGQTQSQLTDAIREYAGRIKNRKCAAYTDQSAKYFDWHAQHVRFGADM